MSERECLDNFIKDGENEKIDQFLQEEMKEINDEWEAKMMMKLNKEHSSNEIADLKKNLKKNYEELSKKLNAVKKNYKNAFPKTSFDEFYKKVMENSDNPEPTISDELVNDLEKIMELEKKSKPGEPSEVDQIDNKTQIEKLRKKVKGQLKNHSNETLKNIDLGPSGGWNKLANQALFLKCQDHLRVLAALQQKKNEAEQIEEDSLTSSLVSEFTNTSMISESGSETSFVNRDKRHYSEGDIHESTIEELLDQTISDESFLSAQSSITESQQEDHEQEGVGRGEKQQQKGVADQILDGAKWAAKGALEFGKLAYKKGKEAIEKRSEKKAEQIKRDTRNFTPEDQKRAEVSARKEPQFHPVVPEQGDIQQDQQPNSESIQNRKIPGQGKRYLPADPFEEQVNAKSADKIDSEKKETLSKAEQDALDLTQIEFVENTPEENMSRLAGKKTGREKEGDSIGLGIEDDSKKTGPGHNMDDPLIVLEEDRTDVNPITPEVLVKAKKLTEAQTKAESEIKKFRDAIEKQKDNKDEIKKAQNAALDALRNDLLALDAALEIPLLKDSAEETAERYLKVELEKLKRKKKTE